LDRPTRGTIEAEIAKAVVKFQHAQHGRGSIDVRAHLLGDLVLVRSTGIFTTVETKLVATDEGRKLIRSARQELRSIHHSEIEELVGSIVGCKVVRSYCDVDVDAAEQMEVYVLADDAERRLLRQDLDRLSGIGPRR